MKAIMNRSLGEDRAATPARSPANHHELHPQESARANRDSHQPKSSFIDTSVSPPPPVPPAVSTLSFPLH